MVGRKESFGVLVGMIRTATPCTHSLCACVFYKLPYLYPNELGLFTSCNMSTLHCPSWYRPDLYFHCGYCATCKWYSVVVWDWKVPHPRGSEHLAPASSTIGAVVEPQDTGTAGGHVTGSMKIITASDCSLGSLLPVYCDVHKWPPPASTGLSFLPC